MIEIDSLINELKNTREFLIALEKSLDEPVIKLNNYAHAYLLYERGTLIDAAHTIEWFQQIMLNPIKKMEAIQTSLENYKELYKPPEVKVEVKHKKSFLRFLKLKKEE